MKRQLEFLIPLGTLVLIAVATIIISLAFSKTFDWEGNLPGKDVRFEPELLDDVTSIFYARLAQYNETTASIKRILYLMVLFAGILLHLIISKPKKFRVPGLDIEASTSWVIGLCPAVLLYLWLSFGCALYSALRSRVFLNGLGQKIEESIAPAIVSERPLQFAVEDSGIVDILYVMSSTSYNDTSTSLSQLFAWLLVAGPYCGLLALMHARTLAGISRWITVTGAQWIGWIYFGMTSALMILSHVVFTQFLPTFTVQQMLILLGGTAFISLLWRHEHLSLRAKKPA